MLRRLSQAGPVPLRAARPSLRLDETVRQAAACSSGSKPPR
jgi:hypothetical protein